MSKIFLLGSINVITELCVKHIFKNKINLIVLCVLMLLSCHQATQAASFDTLVQTAQQCRQQVDELWQQHKQLPHAQRRDFHIAIGRASKNCDDLRELVAQFDKAKILSQDYKKSIQEAQGLIQTIRDPSR